MNKDFYEIYEMVKESHCLDCDIPCSDSCSIFKTLTKIEDLSYSSSSSSFSDENCIYCYDKKRKIDKEIFYDDGRGGLKIADYCPNCGRKLK